MKKVLSSIIGGTLGLALAVSLGVSFMANKNVEYREAEAAEAVIYTLDGTVTQESDQYGNASGYAKSKTVTQNDINWEVYGNTTMNPWRIGGNSITKVDRHVYNTTKFGFQNITKVVLTVGTASNITVNSLTLNVGSTKKGSDVSAVTATFAANSSITFTRPNGANWRNCYFDFVFNVTNTTTSNRFVQFKSAAFYADNAEPTLTSIAIQGDMSKTTYNYGEAWSHDGLTIMGTFSNNTTAEIPSRSATWSYNPGCALVGVNSLTITATVEEKTASYTNNNIVVNKIASPYFNGVQYKMYLTNEGNYYFIGSMNGYYGATTNDASSTSIVNMYFEASGDGQKIYFYAGNDTSTSKQYIYITTSGTHVNFTYGSNASVFYYNGTTMVTYLESKSTIYGMGTYDYYKTFGATAAYQTGNYFAQFELVTALTAENFAQHFLDTIACDSTGATAPTYNYNYTWQGLNDLFDQLSSSEQATLKSADATGSGTIAEAMAKYDYIVAKYGYTNFIQRTITAKANRMVTINTNNMMIIIVVMTFIAAAGAGAFMLLRKKKHN